jgi:hypothetical protein
MKKYILICLSLFGISNSQAETTITTHLNTLPLISEQTPKTNAKTIALPLPYPPQINTLTYWVPTQEYAGITFVPPASQITDPRPFINKEIHLQKRNEISNLNEKIKTQFTDYINKIDTPEKAETRLKEKGIQIPQDKEKALELIYNNMRNYLLVKNKTTKSNN